MRKSNYLILGILVVASIFFLWMWYALNFNLVDNPLDLVLTIVWWAVVGLVILGITMAEKKRKEQIRTTFVARGFVFNPEMGTISLEGSSPVATIQNVITKLEYGFDLQDMPEAKYDCVVRTTKFEDDGDTWEGEVALANNPHKDPMPFNSRSELNSLVEACKAA